MASVLVKMLFLVLTLVIIYTALVTILRWVSQRCAHKATQLIERYAGTSKVLCLDCGHVVLKSYGKNKEVDEARH